MIAYTHYTPACLTKRIKHLQTDLIGNDITVTLSGGSLTIDSRVHYLWSHLAKHWEGVGQLWDKHTVVEQLKMTVMHDKVIGRRSQVNAMMMLS